MKHTCSYLYVRGLLLLEQHAGILLFFLGLALLHSGLTEVSYAASGEEIFDNAACNILNDVLGEYFGAMLTVIAGGLAIVASVAGSFKGAWALLFVSVGCFIAPSVIGVLFPNLSCAGQQ